MRWAAEDWEPGLVLQAAAQASDCGGSAFIFRFLKTILSELRELGSNRTAPRGIQMSTVASQNIRDARQMTGAFGNAFNVNFAVEAPGGAAFAGKMDVLDFGRMKVAQMAFSPHRTRRSYTSRFAGSSLLFNRQVSGKLLVHQDGRAAEIGPGDMYMLNPARDFELDTEAIEVHAIAIDASLLRGVFPEAECCAAIRLPSECCAREPLSRSGTSTPLALRTPRKSWHPSGA